MSAQSFPERLSVAEDEIKGLESMIDSRTRLLWAEIQKLQAEVKELQDMNGRFIAANRNRPK